MNDGLPFHVLWFTFCSSSLNWVQDKPKTQIQSPIYFYVDSTLIYCHFVSWVKVRIFHIHYSTSQLLNHTFFLNSLVLPSLTTSLCPCKCSRATNLIV
uniref:Uncharacterized protein n=1 Tax=Manihot esculenta TaxID=3983 RepID=A0A2C9UNG9_MANES